MNMRHRVNLMMPEVGRDSYGNKKEPLFETFATVWAQVHDLSGRELFSALEQYASVSTLIIIRYRTDIKESWAVQITEPKVRIFDIQAVINTDEADRPKFLNLYCTERKI